LALHFDKAEYRARIDQVARELVRQNLDGLLMFNQESMYYLTGYDTFGFCFFQCLYLGTDGRLALLTRSADLRQARHTSIIEDIRIWTDEAGARPADQLRDMLRDLGSTGKRLGIENNAYGLTHFNGKQVEQALSGFCELVDASDLVTRLRAVK
jgi:Xaa-Pro aminopeptidase